MRESKLVKKRSFDVVHSIRIATDRWDGLKLFRVVDNSGHDSSLQLASFQDSVLEEVVRIIQD